MARKMSGPESLWIFHGLAAFECICGRLLHYLGRFRDRLIGRTSAFGAEYPGSSPGPGTSSIFVNFSALLSSQLTFRGSSARKLQSMKCKPARVGPPTRAPDSLGEDEALANAPTRPSPRELPAGYGSARPELPL